MQEVLSSILWEIPWKFKLGLFQASFTRNSSVDATLIFANFGASFAAVFILALLALLLSSYVKLVTVLSIVRTGFGIYSLPSAFVTTGLALVLSFFVMYPTLQGSLAEVDRILRGTAAPNDQVRAQALNAGIQKWKEFLSAHTSELEKAKFAEIVQQSTPPVDLSNSWRVLAPAFLVSELKGAFATGLSLFLPFLVIDLLVALALAAVGLERLDPVLAAFPFKLLLFVAVDGWALITTNLVAAYHS